MPGPPATPLIEAPARRRPAALPFVAAPSASAATVTSNAHRHGIDVWRIGDLRHRRVERAMAEIEADALVVACYNRLIPAAIYERLPLGGLNLHPSLLPNKRGPDPLFWVFHAGDELAGVTVHQLSDEFDAGGILAQQSLPMPDGISEDELDARLADIGAGLLVECLDGLMRGGLTPQLQDEALATWAPHPRAEDWVIDETWTARRAYNFARGVGSRGHPVYVRRGDEQLRIIDVLGWRPDGECGDVPPGAVAIPLASGTLIARVAPPATA